MQKLAMITFLDERGQPVDPGFGGGFPAGGGHPDQGLPPGAPGHVGGGPMPGRPGHPSQGLPGGNRPAHTWPPQKPSFPPDATDPEWGIEAGGHPSHPIHIPIGGRPDQGLPGGAPGHPDQTLPPVAGHKPPTDPPPGTIWPPLPAGAEPGKAALLFWLQGVGYRYVVVDLTASPDQGLPGQGHVSGQPMPGQPAHPDQGLPGAQPKR